MAKKLSLTQKILVWMAAGLIVGVIINQLFYEHEVAPKLGEFVKNFLVGGIFLVGGKWFVVALKMLVVPLVTFSLISGIVGIGDIKILGKVGSKSFLFYLLTTAIAITLGILVASIIGFGSNLPPISGVENNFTPKAAPPISQVFIDLIPGNPVAAFTDGKMLQIIFFVIIFSICLLMVGEKGKKIIALAEQMNQIMMKMVSLVMAVAPYGVFCLMVKTFSEQGPSLLRPMIWYFSIVIIVLLLHATLTLPLLLKTFSGLNPITFFKKIRPAQIFAFSSASSNATIPVTLRSVEKRMGVDNSVASFTVPFGATINMDGTAIMQGVATMFIATVYGKDLGLAGILTVIGMAVLASIGTAGVPGVGLIMLAMVFETVGLPVEGIGLIIGVDRLLDMVRTAVNITGDAAVTCIVAKGAGKLDEKVFNDPDSGLIES